MDPRWLAHPVTSLLIFPKSTFRDPIIEKLLWENVLQLMGSWDENIRGIARFSGTGQDKMPCIATAPKRA